MRKEVKTGREKEPMGEFGDHSLAKVGRKEGT
jgi:hypothetical protein